MSSFLLAPSQPVRGVARVLWHLAETAVTPLVPADYLDLVSPLRRGADLRGRVVAVEAETADAVTVRIKPGRSWRTHRPGQYIRIGVDVDGIELGDAEGRLTYQPDHPLADEDGMVRTPDMDMGSQMTQLVMAQRGYQASVQVTKTAQDTYSSALQIGK